MLKLAILGFTGRMGQACWEAVQSDDSVTISLGALPESAAILMPDGVEAVQSLNDNFDVAIDFSTPDACLEYVAQCVKLHKPMVIGTTGFTESQWQQLQKASESIPILYASNMSIGVHILNQAVAMAAKMLSGDNVTIDIIETHHTHKKDAPSGTALTLASTIEANHHQPANPPQSIRAGNIVGEHEVRFGMPHERITLKHEAFDRQIFAQGAIKAAKWLAEQPAGWYGLSSLV